MAQAYIQRFFSLTSAPNELALPHIWGPDAAVPKSLILAAAHARAPSDHGISASSEEPCASQQYIKRPCHGVSLVLAGVLTEHQFASICLVLLGTIVWKPILDLLL